MTDLLAGLRLWLYRRQARARARQRIARLTAEHPTQPLPVLPDDPWAEPPYLRKYPVLVRDGVRVLGGPTTDDRAWLLLTGQLKEEDQA